MMFWGAVAGLLLVAVGMLFRPLLRGPAALLAKKTLVVVGLGVPAMALGLYWLLGNLAALESPNNHDLLARADALLVADDDMSGRAEQLINQVLDSEPKNPTALWLAGAVAAQHGDQGKALGYWRSLLPLLADSPQEQAEVQQLIKQHETIAVPPPAPPLPQ